MASKAKADLFYRLVRHGAQATGAFMAKYSVNQKSFKSLFYVSSALAVLGTSSIAGAQETDPAPATLAEAPATKDSNIVVTATRVQRAGFDAPTPVTVLTEKDLRIGSPANIGEALISLPSYDPNSSPTGANLSFSGGGYSVNLRSLGDNRTLLLVNGARPVATEVVGETQTFNLNLIPFNLIERVDVVTGGGSASWGSDAIAGVINIVLKDELDGFDINFQYGDTFDALGEAGATAQNYRIAGSFGTSFADGRGQFMIGIEHQDDAGIFPETAVRSGRFGLISNPDFAPGNGQPQQLYRENVVRSAFGQGGLIRNGVLAGNVFQPNGTLRPFNFGTLNDGFQTVSTDPAAANNFLFGSNSFLFLSVPYERTNAYARATYEVSPDVKISLDYLWAKQKTNAALGADFKPFTIQNDNAYLSTQIRDALADAGETSFTIGRTNEDLGIVTSQLRHQTNWIKLGLDGSAFDDWRWDAFYSYGQNDRSLATVQRDAARTRQSVDAVFDPVTNQPVCRIALTDPTTACVPINILGVGNATPAAINWFTGIASVDQDLRQHEAAFNLRGEPFQINGEAVSFATGLAYRNIRIESTQSALNANGASFFPIGIPGDGTVEVIEGYAEAIVPLLRDTAFSKAFDVQLALRLADYSAGGVVPAWKVGFTNDFNDSIRLRGTYSRDIRAATNGELFAGRVSIITQVSDPFTNTNPAVIVNTGGNPNLGVEEADTFTVGLVFTPSGLPELRASVDYFDVTVNGAISRSDPQTIVDQCFAGNQASCGQISRDDGQLSLIEDTFFNFASISTRGVDFELSYAKDVNFLARPGQVTFRNLLTWVDSFVEDDGITTIQRVGEGDTFEGVPEVVFTSSLAYENDAFGVNARARFISETEFDNQITTDVNIPAVVYVDVGGSIKLPFAGESEIYGTINNLFDTIPVEARQASQFDVIGRRFVVGFRTKF